MIYMDTSVLLAELLAEDHRPSAETWSVAIFSSRLLEYESWSRLHALGLARSHGDHLRQLLQRINFVELAPPVLARALEPFPKPVRTLDGLHLASFDFLWRQKIQLKLASLDHRMLDAARALGFPLASAATTTSSVTKTAPG